MNLVLDLRSFFFNPAVCGLLAVLLNSTGAWAQAQNADVIILTSQTECCPEEAWPEVEQALKAELELLDIEVRVVPGMEKDDVARRAELEELAVAENAAATIRILKPVSADGASKADVELWISDRVVGKTTYRKIKIDNTNSPDAVTVVAIRAVDALRASLLELRVNKETTTDVQPSKKIKQLVIDTEMIGKDTEKTITVGIGVQALYSPGGAGALGGFFLSAGWHPFPFGGIMLDVMYAPLGEDLVANESTTTIDLLLIRGFLSWRILQKKIVTPFLAAGGGGAIVFADGKTSDTTRIGYVGGRVGLDVNLGSRFRIGAGFTVGAFLPEVTLSHGDKSVAAMGRPLLEWLICFEVRLP